MRWLAIRVLTLIVAALLASPVSALGRARYRCHMTGQVGESCCCAAERTHGTSGARTSKLGERDCCERVSLPTDALVPGIPDKLGDAPHALPCSVIAFELRGIDSAGEQTARAVARAPPTGLRLFLANCALLI